MRVRLSLWWFVVIDRQHWLISTGWPFNRFWAHWWRGSNDNRDLSERIGPVSFAIIFAALVAILCVLAWAGYDPQFPNE